MNKIILSLISPLFPLFLFSGELNLEFAPEKCSVDKIENNLAIECILKVSLIGVPEKNEYFLQEKEIEGEVSGDFRKQMISPLNGKLNSWHHPFPLKLEMENLKDRVMTMIDLNRPFNEGKVHWRIPVTISNSDNSFKQILYVDQIFKLSNGFLFLEKGNELLYSVDLKKWSTP